jgi:riboflavin kinase/FMN adenylyltransferase
MGEFVSIAFAADKESWPVLVWHGVSEIPRDLGPTVVTIGNFDGVHLGHRHVIERSRELASELGGLPVVAVTFDPHPMRVLLPERAPVALVPVDERLSLLAAAGVDATLVLTFDKSLAQTSPEDFVTTMLLDGLGAAGVVVGSNFRFGHRARGDLTLLEAICADRGVTVVGLQLDGEHGHVWSSSYIRIALAEGDVVAAAEALGRPFTLRGVVVRGDQRGRELGFPTANVPVHDPAAAVPADGVYAGWLRWAEPTASADLDGSPAAADGGWLPAAISIGTNPTFDGTERRVESYVLDRTDLELYGVTVEVAFVRRLRGMVKFDSVDELIDQMTNDVDEARALLVSPPDWTVE